MLRTEYLTCITVKFEKSLTDEEILTLCEGFRFTDLVVFFLLFFGWLLDWLVSWWLVGCLLALLID